MAYTYSVGTPYEHQRHLRSAPLSASRRPTLCRLTAIEISDHDGSMEKQVSNTGDLGGKARQLRVRGRLRLVALVSTWTS